jgi:integrase
MAVRKRAWTTRKGELKTAWVVDYKDQNGKRRLKTFDRKKDADAWATTAHHEVKQGVHTPDSTSLTVGQAADVWVQRGETEGLEHGTLVQYRNHVERHIKPHSIAQTKLSQLATPSVEAFKRDLERDKGKKMARKVLGSLKSIIREAQRQGMVAQNVAQPVTVRNVTRGQSRPEVGADVPSKDEVKAMLGRAEGRWRALLVTAVFTGLRSSELRGLTWDHVDFDERVIRVRQRADRWNDMGDPKSAAGRRDIPMTKMVANTLKEWRLQCPKGELGLVFPNGQGRHENHANIYNRGLAPIQKAAGVTAEGQDDNGKPVQKPKYSLHSLRHFYASWLIGEGFSPKRVQTLLGHSSIQMTFDVYGHWLSTQDDYAKLDAAVQSFGLEGSRAC